MRLHTELGLDPRALARALQPYVNADEGMRPAEVDERTPVFIMRPELAALCRACARSEPRKLTLHDIVKLTAACVLLHESTLLHAMVLMVSALVDIVVKERVRGCSSAHRSRLAEVVDRARDRCAAWDSSRSPLLLGYAGLRAAMAAIATAWGVHMVFSTEAGCEGLGRDLLRVSAPALAALEPGTPHTCGCAVRLLMLRGSCPSPREVLGHVRRGLQAAEQAGSSVWTAYYAYVLLRWGEAGPPALATALLHRADAAYAAAKQALPRAFLSTLVSLRQCAKPARRHVQQHQGLEQWGASARDWLSHHEAGAAGPDRQFYVETRWRRCAACGKHEVAADLKPCAACLGAWYSSRACQVDHWPEHKPACRAVSKAAEHAGGGKSKSEGGGSSKDEDEGSDKTDHSEL